MLSCLLLLLTGAYGWLLAAKERRERSLLSMLDRLSVGAERTQRMREYAAGLIGRNR